MPSNYGTSSNYGETSTYTYIVVIAGVYGTTNYGTGAGGSSYNAPVYASASPSQFGLETLMRNFTNDLGIVRYNVVKASDPLVASSESNVVSTYNLDVIFESPKLSTLVQFKAEEIVEAETMTRNFQLLADVIRSTSDDQDFNTGPVLTLAETAAEITEVDSLHEGLAFSYNASLTDQDIDATATRKRTEQAKLSSALLLDSYGIRLFSADGSDSTTVDLAESFGFFNNNVLLSSAIYDDNKNGLRGLYQAFDEPVVLSGLNPSITTAQQIAVDTKSRVTNAIELSIEVSTNSTTPIDIDIQGVDLKAGVGYKLYVPSGNRVVTKRIRIPLASGKKLQVKLSQKCNSITLRVLGTWS